MRLRRYPCNQSQHGAVLTEAAVALAILLVVFLVGSFLMINGAKRRAESVEDAVARPVPCDDLAGDGGFRQDGDDNCK